MADLEKVINGLELCGYMEGMPQCDSCPYDGKQCWKRLKNDALVFLKAQEPRVITLEKMREGEVYWFDCPGNFILRPVICNMYDRGDSSYLNFVWQYGNFSWKISEYGRTWRCWTSRPTDEQREATPWN